MTSTNSSGIEAALELAKMADVIVLALGIDKTVEHEGVDRKSIELPGLQVHTLPNSRSPARTHSHGLIAYRIFGWQASFAKAVFALGKPTVLVLTNGGPLAIDDLIEGADAIVEAFNPGFGAQQVRFTSAFSLTAHCLMHI